MAKILKLTAALATARADAKAAREAHEGDPANRILRATYLGTISAVLSAAAALAKADPKVSAKMTKVTEKYTQRKERMEESDEEEEESVPASTAKSSEPDSSEEESEEEESAAASMPMSSKPKPSEEEEEAAASEEEEEAVVTKGMKAAHAAYLKATKGTDAYGVFGPKGIAKAVLKATGQTSIKAALGALAALPRKAKADAKVAKDVEVLKADADRAKIEAIVTEAKADGRASTKILRAELRTIGAKMGPKYLKAFAANLPKIGRTGKDGAALPGDDGEGNARGGPDGDAQARMMEQAMAGMNKEERAEFKALLAEKNRRSNGTAGRA